jgi:hypothetical protein
VSYITIFLSSATGSRINKHTVGLQGLWESFLDNNNWLTGYLYTFVPVLFIIFSLLGCTKKYRLLLWSLPMAVAYFFMSSLWRNVIGTSLLLFAYMLFVCISLLKNKETRECGKFLTCGYGMFFMLSVTVGGFRTCMPFLIMFFIVLTILYFDVISQNKNKIKWLFITILTLYSCSSFVNSQKYFDGFNQMSKDYVKPTYNSFVQAKDTNKIMFYIIM